jgi:hypothetical protein
VTDIFGAASAADDVTVSFENLLPVAVAGADQSVLAGETVSLDAGASSDGNGDQLTYAWSFISKPAQSLAQFTNPSSGQTSFTTDEPGEYVVNLVVNDGFADSNDSMMITAISPSEEAVRLLLETIDIVQGLDPAILKNGNLTKDSIINKINVVLDMINDGKYDNAMGKLQNDVIERTDGCTNAGEPDSNDWITTCEGQSEVYLLTTEAMGYLQNLI